jgi:hypothetical protein
MGGPGSGPQKSGLGRHRLHTTKNGSVIKVRVSYHQKNPHTRVKTYYSKNLGRRVTIPD